MKGGNSVPASQRCACEGGGLDDGGEPARFCCQPEFGWYRRARADSADLNAEPLAEQRLLHELEEGRGADGDVDVTKNRHHCEFYRDPDCVNRKFVRNPFKFPVDETFKSTLHIFNADGKTAPGWTADASGKDRYSSSLPAAGVKRVNVAIVQRMPKFNRMIENLDVVMKYLSDFKASVLVLYLEDLTPSSQYFLATQTDVWIGVTGAGQAWASFVWDTGVVFLRILLEE